MNWYTFRCASPNTAAEWTMATPAGYCRRKLRRMIPRNSISSTTGAIRQISAIAPRPPVRNLCQPSLIDELIGNSCSTSICSRLPSSSKPGVSSSTGPANTASVACQELGFSCTSARYVPLAWCSSTVNTRPCASTRPML